MKKLIVILFFAILLNACSVVPEENTAKMPEQEYSRMITLTIGDHTIHAQLADNPSAKALSELLHKGPVAMPASNYGGFEKVCSLGTRLPSNNVQTTTQPGDIMLYSSSQIVIFYGTNSWAYTRLAKVAEADLPHLRSLLSGSEDTVTIALEG